jgi:CDP-paratose synthetase
LKGGVRLKVLLTGATGFLGSNILKALVNLGYEIIILKRTFSDLKKISSLLPHTISYDIDTIELSEIFKKHKDINIIIHTATNYGRNEDKDSTLLKENVLFPMLLMEYGHSNNVSAFLNTDSYFNKNNNNYIYLGSYILTKSQLIQWAKIILTKGNMKFVNIKLEHIYGPYDSLSKFSKSIMDSCLSNVDELDLTEGLQKRDFVYVSDVVRAYLIIIDKINLINENFKEYEVGTGFPISVREFVETAHRLTKSKTRLNFGALPMRQHEIMESKADITELKSLGWEPYYNIIKGLEETLMTEGYEFD